MPPMLGPFARHAVASRLSAWASPPTSSLKPHRLPVIGPSAAAPSRRRRRSGTEQWRSEARSSARTRMHWRRYRGRPIVAACSRPPPGQTRRRAPLRLSARRCDACSRHCSRWRTRPLTSRSSRSSSPDQARRWRVPTPWPRRRSRRLRRRSAYISSRSTSWSGETTSAAAAHVSAWRRRSAAPKRRVRSRAERVGHRARLRTVALEMEEDGAAARLGCVSETAEQRLAVLLRVLKSPPASWVIAACEIPRTVGELERGPKSSAPAEGQAARREPASARTRGSAPGDAPGSTQRGD